MKEQTEQSLSIPSPETALMDFLQSVYEANAKLTKCDRKALERQQGTKL